MRKINILVTTILAVILASCSTEIDTTTVEETTTMPTQGEIVTMAGLVKDTAGQVVAYAQVKATVRDYSFATQSDEGGRYSFEIPKVEDKLILIADKEQYVPTIIKQEELTNKSDLSIYLRSDANNNTVDLTYNKSNYFDMAGTIVDQSGMPVKGVTVRAFSLGGGTMINYINFGVADTDAEGRWKITAEKEETNEVIVEGFLPWQCASIYFDFQDYTSSDLDFGESTMDLGVIEQTNTQATTANCMIDVELYHSPGAVLAWYDLDINSQNTIEYCEHSVRSEDYIFSVFDEDYQNFDALFYKYEDIPEVLVFDYCAPEGDFIELIVDSKKYLFTDFTVTGHDIFSSAEIIAQSEEYSLFTFSRSTYFVLVDEGGKVWEADLAAEMGNWAMIANTESGGAYVVKQLATDGGTSNMAELRYRFSL